MESLSILLISLGSLFIATRLILSEVSSLTSRLQSSRFGTAFVLLGLLTSLTEISVATNAQIDGRPDIYTGNLIGGSFVILMLIIPLLAILRRGGIPFGNHFDSRKLIAFMGLVSAPIMFMIDGEMHPQESIALILAYVAFILFQVYTSKKHPPFGQFLQKKVGIGVLKITTACIVILVSCHFLVEQTEQLAVAIGIPAFIISITLLSLGTNIPEISIGIASAIKRKTDIAFADYIGSAALNPLTLGVFSLINGAYTIELGWFKEVLYLFLIGNVLFLTTGLIYKKIPRTAAFFLFLYYIIVIILQALLTVQ